MELPVPSDPVKIALIGCGNRARSIYQPLFSSLKPWVELVAVCDPLKNHCDEMAAALEVPPYYDVRALVRDKPMEAGLIVVPVPGHHSLVGLPVRKSHPQPLRDLLVQHGVPGTADDRSGAA